MRKWLMVPAVGALCVAGTLAWLVLTVPRGPIHVAFDKVQVGMTAEEAHKEIAKVVWDKPTLFPAVRMRFRDQSFYWYSGEWGTLIVEVDLKSTGRVVAKKLKPIPLAERIRAQTWPIRIWAERNIPGVRRALARW
jgi:hypothetical protein